MKNAIDTVIERCLGSFQIMIGRPEGLRRIDFGPGAFQLSFWAFPLSLIFELYRLTGQQNVSTAEHFGSVVVNDIIYSAMLWFLPLIALWGLARLLNFTDRFAAYVIVSNWGTLTISFLFTPLTILDFLSPENGFVTLLLVIALMASLWMAYNLARIILEREPMFCVGICAFNFLMALAVFAIFRPLVAPVA